MGPKIEARYGIQEMLRTGNGMKISLQDRETLISIGGIRDSFEIDDGMQDLKSNWPF